MKHYTSKQTNNNQWLLTASIDGDMVDFETIIEQEKEPDFWQCYDIAQKHNCEFFHIEQLELD